MIEINIDGLHLRVDRDRAVDLLEDMTRVNWSNVNSSSITDRLYNALFHALKTAPVETLSWGPGKWERTSSGDYVWRRHIHHAHRPMEVGPVLARIERLESREWKPWIYPYGEGRGNGLPQEVVYWRMPTRTLRDAQAVAQSTFVAQRKAIEEA